MKDQTSKLLKIFNTSLLATGLFSASTAFSCAKPPPEPISTYTSRYSPYLADIVGKAITKCYSSPQVQCTTLAFQNCGIEGMRAATTAPPDPHPPLPTQEQSPPPPVPQGPTPSEFKAKYPPKTTTRADAHREWSHLCYRICLDGLTYCDPSKFVSQPWKNAALQAQASQKVCDSKATFIDSTYHKELPTKPTKCCTGLGCLLGCK